MPTAQARRHRLEAYVVIVILSAIGFWRLDNQQDSLERQDRAIERNRVVTSTEICTKVNDLSQAMKVIIQEATQPDPEDSPIEIEDKEKFNRFAQQELDTLQCEELVRRTPLGKE